MKITNNENNQEVLYIQNKDLIQVFNNCERFPVGVISDILLGKFVINKKNKNDFVRITDSREISFFKNQDWILDYREIKDISHDEIIEYAKNIVNELTRLQEEINNTKDNDKINEIIGRQIKLKYKLDGVREFLWFKDGNIEYPFPLIPDGTYYSYSSPKNIYKMSSSLVPNKLLLYRKDGEKLSEKEDIPKFFIQTGISVILMNSDGKYILAGEWDIKKSFSKDNKYLVISIKEKEHEEKNEEDDTKTHSENGIKRLLKRFFKEGN